MTSDLDLLRQFARKNSQEAFAALVQRHLNLVYTAALRQVRAPQLAEEIAQSVFADLARQAGKISGAGVSPASFLTPWLYAVTRRTAVDVVRKESRRRLREQIAVEMNSMNATANEWTQIEPLLDDAMAALDETDRNAVLLRYFENKSLREVGEALGASEDAAQKRVSRTVERLREFFSKRNVTIGAGGLTVLISANAVQSAPVGLAATISAAAILTGTAVSTSTAIATTKVIAMTTFQKTIIGAVLATAVGTGIFEAHQASQLREQNQTLQQQQAPLAEQIRQLQTDNKKLSNRLAEAGDSRKLSDEQFNELLKLRGQIAQLRNAAEVENDPAFQKARLWLAKEKILRQQFEEHPDQWIPEMKFLSSEEWLDLARKANLDTAKGMRCALSNVRSAATFDFAQKVSIALREYMGANNQQLPDSISQLSAYFHPPLDDANTLLSRYKMLNSEEQANPKYKGASIIQDPKTLVDHIDNVVLIGPTTTSSVAPPSWPPGDLPDELKPVEKAYEEANHDGFLSIYDLDPYATTPAQKEALNKFIRAATTPH
jgi:RNA polymerase sigma factor (sigma-70 family)